MDSISNLIIKIKNGSKTGKDAVIFPYSKMAYSILEVLAREGFVSGISKKGKKSKFIEIKLAYTDKKPAVSEVKRISKFSKRVYFSREKIRSVREGYGKMIISTSKGIMTDKEARKFGVGGEALFEIW
jgi:small subunit ribosomal protein S8